MITKISNINHRSATKEEELLILQMSEKDFEQFLAESIVAQKHTKLFAIKNGVAYSLKKLAKKRKKHNNV